MRVWGWLILGAWGLAGGGVWGPVASAAEQELLRDRGFARGFNLLSPAPGKKVVVRQVRFAATADAPVWQLAQWHSRFSLADAPLRHGPDDVWSLTNVAKTLRVRAPGQPDAELVLGVDSRPEYDHYRRPGEPWPHLLVQQDIRDCPPLDALRAMPLRLRARVTRSEVFKGAGYDRGLHCAQCPLVLIVQNRNPASPGFGDFFWFQVPLFDDRWPFPPPHVAQDTADPSAKLIYNPGLKAYTDQSLWSGEWVDLSVDLLPHLRAGLRTAWAKGYLRGSQNEGDYRLSSFILGWEVPGINRAEIRFRDLSLRAVSAGLPAFDFTDPAEAARWTPNDYVASAVPTAEGLELTLAGRDPSLLGPAADYPAGQPLWLRLELYSETAGPCQLFYYRTSPSEGQSVRFVVPAGQWVTGRVPVPALGAGYHLRIDPPGTSGRCVLKSLRAETRGPLPEFDFRTLPDATDWEPTHDIAALTPTPEGLVVEISGPDPYTVGPARDYPVGQKLWMHLRVKSEQAGAAQLFFFPDHPTEENSVHFFVPGGQWHEAIAPVPALGRNWRLRLDPPGRAGACLLERLWFEERVAYPPPNWPSPEPPDLGADPFVLEAGEVVLRHARDRLGAFEVRVAGEPLAVGLPNGLLGYVEGEQPVWTAWAGAATGDLENGALRMRATMTDPGGAHWRVEQRFAPDGEGALAVETRVSVDRDREVLYLPLFTLLPGAGSFGTNKTQALFSGLEYLANEPSSSEADIRGDGARRLAPDARKITLPFMALAAEERYLGLSWQPAPEWCAVFDSPDRQFHGGGHLMGLIAPGSDGFNRDEGSLVPYRPLRLAAGRTWTVRATVLGGRGESVVPALQHYLSRAGWPAPPEAVPAADDYFALAAHGWLDSRLREGNLYRHAWWPGFDPMPASDAAVWMQWLAGRVNAPDLPARLTTAAREALTAVGDPTRYDAQQIGHVRYPLPSLIFNQVPGNADRAAATARSLLTRFEPDGRLFYHPPADGIDYGSTHFAPDASGHTAQVVKSLLEAAVFAGDETLIREALDKLRVMDQFRNTVPRGAQTWEIPLHTPDILAAAWLVRCYTLGYALTGDPDYLAQARYWAWTGVPFVYLHPPTPGDIGLYATIPVYGATGWVGSWFGRPVQWCGLVYADALNRLAPCDPDGPWRALADGIAASGVQQTWPADDPERLGLLPDFFRLSAQFRSGPAINPSTTLAPALRYYGAPAPYAFRVFRASGLRLHAPGVVSDSSETPDTVAFRFTPWLDTPVSVFLNGLRETPRLRLNGRDTPLGAPHQFDAATGRLILRLRGPTRVELLLSDRPRLEIHPGPETGQIELRWPRTYGNWLLEATPQLAPSDWRITEFRPYFVGNVVIARLPAFDEARYYRLRTRP